MLYALCRINVTKCRSDFRFKNHAASLTNLLIKTVIIAGRLCVGFNKFIMTEFVEYFFIKDAVTDRASVSVIAVLKAGCVLMLMIQSMRFKLNNTGINGCAADGANLMLCSGLSTA